MVEAPKQIHPTHCRMLVLAPTRELASQIADSARDYGKFSKMSVATVFGGTSINKNRQDMARGVDILVATPGRLLDLIEQRFVSLAMLEILVLDEADQMLDLGFIHALRRISELVPVSRQTLFFSATMPKSIKELVGKYCRNPVTVSVTPAATTAERIDQYLFMVQQDEKPGRKKADHSERAPGGAHAARPPGHSRRNHSRDQRTRAREQQREHGEPGGLPRVHVQAFHEVRGQPRQVEIERVRDQKVLHPEHPHRR